MIPDSIIKAHYGLPCSICGDNLTHARIEGLAVCHVQDRDTGRPQPMLLVRCRRCAHRVMVMLNASRHEVIWTVKEMYDYLREQSNPPVSPPGDVMIQRTTGGEKHRAVVRPSLRPNHPRGPITDHETMRFRRILKITSFKRKSKGLRRFLDRLLSQEGRPD